jgi:hypothetical protein
MNKYIIIIILILIILYLVHAKKNKEKFTESSINIDGLTKLLLNNKIGITDSSGNITINSQPITLDSSGNIAIGKYIYKSDYSILDKTSNRNINTDPSGNITIDDITYNVDSSLSNTNINKNVNIYQYVTKVVLQKIHNNGTDTNVVDINSQQYFPVFRDVVSKQLLCSTRGGPVSFNNANYYNDLIKYPLNISGLKFQDINNVDISFNKYTTTPKNLMVHTTSPIEITSENLYNNINGTNKFIGYSNNTPAPINGDIHSYTFTFTQPQLIKNIVIANRRDGFQNALNNTTLLIYGKNSNNTEVLLKSISLNNFDTNPYYIANNFFTKSTTAPAPLTVNLYP